MRAQRSNPSQLCQNFVYELEQNAMGNKTLKITRRKFLEQSGTGIVSSILAVYSVTGCALTKRYRVTLKNGRFVAAIQQYPELLHAGGSIILEPDGSLDPIVIVNIDGVTFSAVSAVCTHMGCIIGVAENFFLCPCHGSTYDLNGGVVRGPAARSLKKFKTEVKNGNITIIINHKEK